MRPKKHETTEEEDLFRARLDQIIDMKHELVQLAGRLDWDWLDGEIAPLRHRGRDRTHEDRRSPRPLPSQGRRCRQRHPHRRRHNLRLVLAWLRALLCLIVLALLQAFATPSALKSAS